MDANYGKCLQSRCIFIYPNVSGPILGSMAVKFSSHRQDDTLANVRAPRLLMSFTTSVGMEFLRLN